MMADMLLMSQSQKTTHTFATPVILCNTYGKIRFFWRIVNKSFSQRCTQRLVDTVFTFSAISCFLTLSLAYLLSYSQSACCCFCDPSLASFGPGRPGSQCQVFPLKTSPSNRWRIVSIRSLHGEKQMKIWLRVVPVLVLTCCQWQITQQFCFRLAVLKNKTSPTCRTMTFVGGRLGWERLGNLPEGLDEVAM